MTDVQGGPNACFTLGPGDIVRFDPTTGALSSATDSDPYGFKAKFKTASFKARADAAARGLTEGYWWARWAPERPWEPVELVTNEIEGIEPYLEVWVIGREYAYDLTDYVFLEPVAGPDDYLG